MVHLLEEKPQLDLTAVSKRFGYDDEAPFGLVPVSGLLKTNCVCLLDSVEETE